MEKTVRMRAVRGRPACRPRADTLVHPYSVKFADVSAAMVKEKVNRITESKADYVIATDVSCLMNIGGYITRNNKPVKVMHLAQLLMQ